MPPPADDYNLARLRHVNEAVFRSQGKYVLYWMQIYRRLDYNHALNYALACSAKLGLPLVIYEGLKLGYPWANRRLHRFILEGMLDNRRAAQKLDLNYWPFVETPDDSGRGLLRRLAEDAAVVVTDDFPCFIVPEQTEALAKTTSTPVIAVDGNCVVPLANLGSPPVMAAHLRPRIHKAFAEAWQYRSGTRQRIPDCARKAIDPPFAIWEADELDAFLATLPVDATVAPVANMPGGSYSAKKRLRSFVQHRLAGYAENRSKPGPPDQGHASGLSPYLHFGHLSIEEVVETVLESVAWKPDDLNLAQRGKREGYFCDSPDINSFLDEALTWRDVGFVWHRTRRNDTESLEKSLPVWAWQSLQKHIKDRRTHEYSLEEWEAAQTHDPLWNAAQTELKLTGTIHNYLRMLWGKKVIEWSKSPDEAYRILVHLNNKYALDGRNPNSYTGILWCFGLFDRPWFPERDVLGAIRYMSSENTGRKFKLNAYYEYVGRLPG